MIKSLVSRAESPHAASKLVAALGCLCWPAPEPIERPGFPEAM